MYFVCHKATLSIVFFSFDHKQTYHNVVAWFDQGEYNKKKKIFSLTEQVFIQYEIEKHEKNERKKNGTDR